MGIIEIVYWCTLINIDAVGHTKIPLFFPNMDISIAIHEDVRKNASVKNQGVSSSIRAATALLSFRGVFSWNLGVPISKKYYIFIFT